MNRLAQHVILAWGWKRRLIALLSGASGALALAPVDFFPALLVPMTAAIWLLDGSAAGPGRVSAASLRAAAAVGWWWGFGYFLAGLWWLGAAFLVEADQWAWALPLGVIALPAGLALFPALGFALARLLWTPGAARVLIFAAALSLTEFLRGTVLTGFPWNTFGMALGGNLVLAQAGALIGLYGLTLLAVAIAAAPATLADPAGRARWINPAVTAAALLFAALGVFGAARLSLGGSEMVKGVALRIMQPNIAQDAKFRPENKDAILRRYLTLSDRATSPAVSGLASVTHLIWPESAFPFILARDAQALGQIGRALPPATVLVTGAVRVVEPGPGEKRPHYFNSIQVIESGGAISASADKVHLVPFGEYLPLSGLLNRLGLSQFVHVPGGFEAGAQRALLRIRGLPPAAPLICYEIIFPGEALPLGSAAAARPGLLLNVTNDGWFGLTSGPYQHLAQARLRAIEEGLPLVRAANTGISAVIDPYGRVIGKIPLGTEDVLDSALPKVIEVTLYSKISNYSFMILLVVFFIACVSVGAWRKR